MSHLIFYSLFLFATKTKNGHPQKRDGQTASMEVALAETQPAES